MVGSVDLIRAGSDSAESRPSGSSRGVLAG